MKAFYSIKFLAITIVLLSQFNQAIAQGSLDALDEKNGFKDAKFGMPLSSFNDMRPVGDSKPEFRQGGYNGMYYRPSDTKKIGDISLESIQYQFDRGKLIQVVYVIVGAENCSKALRALRSAYGPGEETIIGYVWEGKNILMDVLRGKDVKDGKAIWRFTLSSQKMYRDNREEMIRKRKAEAAKNAKDF